MEKNKCEISDDILEKVSGGTGNTPILRKDVVHPEDGGYRSMYPTRCIRCQRTFGSYGENVCPDCEQYYIPIPLKSDIPVSELLQIAPEVEPRNPFNKLH